MHDIALATTSIPIVSRALQRTFRSWDGLLEWLPVGVYVCDRQGGLLQYNRRAAELWGRAPAIGDSAVRFCGTYKAYGPDGAPLDLARSPMSEVLRTGQPVRDRELVIERPDRTRRTILANLDALRDEDGDIVGGVNCFQDVTELKRAEEAEREGERRSRELLDALPAAVYTTDAAGRITFFNKAAVDLWGCEPELGASQWCGSFRLAWPDGRPMAHDECPMATALRENRPVRGGEAIALRPDGAQVPFLAFPTPLRDEAGGLVGAVNMLVDITERKRAETRQTLLLAELKHRVKNTLMTVLSIAARTRRTAADLPRFVEAFEGRLLALARAHDLLARDILAGALLGDLARDTLAPFGDRVAAAGPAVRLGPEIAVTMAVALHELTTNAARHGALSVPEGRVALDWAVERPDADAPERLVLRWTEDGGPAPTGPICKGFGLDLVERGLARQLGGTAELAFAPGGLQCRIVAPVPRRPEIPV